MCWFALSNSLVWCRIMSSNSAIFSRYFDSLESLLEADTDLRSRGPELCNVKHRIYFQITNHNINKNVNFQSCLLVCFGFSKLSVYVRYTRSFFSHLGQEVSGSCLLRARVYWDFKINKQKIEVKQEKFHSIRNFQWFCCQIEQML